MVALDITKTKRLIEINSQDPEPGNTQIAYTRGILKKINKQFSNGKAGLSLFLAFSFFVFPTAIGGTSEVRVEKLYSSRQDSYNSQTIAILESSMTPDLRGPIGGAEIIIKNENALLASIGTVTDGVDLSNKKTGDIVVPKTDIISVYTVKSGDTISEIAEKHNVSVNTIKWANDMNAVDKIKIGQQLVILPISGVTHVVEEGQTISTISEKYDGDIAEILSFNGIADANTIKVGDKLVIPNGEVAAPKQKEASKIVSTPIQTKAVPVTNTTPSVQKPSNNNYYIKPVNGVITQGFHGNHEAMDIGNKTGTPVYAMAEGVVIKASGNGAWSGGYGNLVIISHPNGTQTLYAHLNTVNVVAGQQVKQGEVIAGLGNTGRSTGPHLHYEVRGIKTPILY